MSPVLPEYPPPCLPEEEHDEEDDGEGDEVGHDPDADLLHAHDHRADLEAAGDVLGGSVVPEKERKIRIFVKKTHFFSGIPMRFKFVKSRKVAATAVTVQGIQFGPQQH